MESLRVYGEPPYRIVLVHGGPGAGGEMGPVARRLSRNAGVLEPIQTALSVEGQISELSEIIERRAAPPVVLAGYSWGAWLSMLTAARHPELVAKLILISCPALDEDAVAGMRERRLARLSEPDRAEFHRIAATLEDPETADKDHLLARLGELAAKTDDFDAEPAEDAVILNGEIYQHVWPEAAELRRTGALLASAASLRCPVTIMHGAHDSPAPEAIFQALDATVLRAGRTTHAFGRCGHTPWREKHARDTFFQVMEDETRLDSV